MALHLDAVSAIYDGESDLAERLSIAPDPTDTEAAAGLSAPQTPTDASSGFFKSGLLKVLSVSTTYLPSPSRAMSRQPSTDLSRIHDRSYEDEAIDPALNFSPSEADSSGDDGLEMSPTVVDLHAPPVPVSASLVGRLRGAESSRQSSFRRVSFQPAVVLSVDGRNSQVISISPPDVAVETPTITSDLSASSSVDSTTTMMPAVAKPDSSLPLPAAATPMPASAPTPSKKAVLAGYAMLVVALLAVSSLGAATLLMKDVDPVLAGAWRLQCAAFFLLPLFLWQAHTKVGWTSKAWLAGVLTRRNILHGLGVTVGMFLFSATFFVALSFTSLAHAYLFNNLHSVIIVLFRIIKRQPVMVIEIVGTAISVLGAGLALVNVTGNAQFSTTNIVIGDMIALVGSVGAVGYLVWAKRLRAEVPLFVYILPVNVLNAVLTLVLSVAMEGSSAGPGVPLAENAFGWLSQEFILGALYLGVVTGVLGMVAYAGLLNVVSPLVIAVVMLLEPAVGTVIGILLGVEHVPDNWTIAGGFVTLVGTVAVTLANGVKSVQLAKQQQLLQQQEQQQGHDSDCPADMKQAEVPAIVISQTESGDLVRQSSDGSDVPSHENEFELETGARSRSNSSNESS
ncbi:hypothetical protein CAOG_00072 [Capsaspora owczarzaki ATCC 30864]|uniref:EamA domain-containing protein n=1 Tax=Capsaspora owczarzaki (strain ATCC 30864) TaxID=595528 RepID=A0A0D2X044_CAPO3|nr:hypothetical protein CAOG_00072 [Capsaspora owczarzaki ATCC 30864]KJE88414.1 hypothetical protein CAOG_000072 [Capsaspora owczarzaki ATCC 30864]|eukprot:XP_004364943.1 hypothetical protein CAOG_00072 [Capsaspora owczarzaki ATCC 30864]